MKLIGEGRQSTAYLLDGKRVLLVAKHAEAFENYKNQKIIYDILDGKIACVNIPQNADLISPCEKYPFGAMSIPYVPGMPPKLETFTEQEKIKLGKQLAKLIYEFQKVGESLTKKEIEQIQKLELKTDCTAVDQCCELVKKYLTNDEYNKLVEIAKIYKDACQSKTRILHHGDLNPANLTVDKDKNLIGIIDFEGVGFFIPEYKLKNQWRDEIVFNTVKSEYHKLGGVLIHDKRFTEVCEIITMILHLRRFYCLGKSQIELRVGIIKELLQRFHGKRE